MVPYCLYTNPNNVTLKVGMNLNQHFALNSVLRQDICSSVAITLS